MGCKGTCGKWKVRPSRKRKHAFVVKSVYSLYKRCSTCASWLTWKGTFCPCCGYRLRHTSRKDRASREGLKRI